MPDDIDIRTDPAVTTDSDHTATPADAAYLHDYPLEVDADPGTVTVAVMDSGISREAVRDHPWFDGVQVVGGHDATGDGLGDDRIGHGTAVASIYGKMAPHVELVDVRIFGATGRTGMDTIRRAYNYLIRHADDIDIVNMSWGATRNYPNINQLHKRLLDQGVIDVVAAGNTGSNGGSPATQPDAFSAGAVTEDGVLTRFSSEDPNRDNPDVAALGKDVKLARAPRTNMGRVLNEDFVKASGTSFAAPYLGAAYAHALAEEHREWDGDIESAAAPIEDETDAHYGLLKVEQALTAEDGPDAVTTSGSSWDFGEGEVLYINEDWLPDGDTTVERVEDTDEHITLRVQK